MGFLDDVTTGVQSVPRRTLIHAAHGLGKTTFAAKWPKPILIPTEDGFAHVDITATKKLTSSRDVWSAVKECVSSSFETIVIDSVDWLEHLIWKELAEEGFKMDFGKGNLEAARRFGSVLEICDVAREAGKHILLIGHTTQIRVEHPNGMTWDQMAVNLSKGCRALVSEWCDEMLYAEADMAVSQKEETFGRTRNVGIDKGRRVFHTVGKPAYQAKNRVPNLPEKFDLSDAESYISAVTNSNSRGE